VLNQDPFEVSLWKAASYAISTRLSFLTIRAKVEPQESETPLLPEVHHSAFLLVYLYSELCEFFPHSFLQRRYDPAMPRMGIY
jgi:hypothetical protein